MINLLLAGAGLALITIICHAWWSSRRRRQARANLRHITGAYQWWGKR